MRTLALVVSLALLVACSSGDDGSQGEAGGAGPASIETHEDVARLAVSALNAGSLEPFEPARVRAEDVREALESLRRESGEEKYKDALADVEAGGGFDGFARAMREKSARFFESILNEIPEPFGPVDWSKAEFDGMNPEKTSIRNLGGMEGGDVWFWVKAGEMRYSFRLWNCMNTTRGWVCTKGIRLLLEVSETTGGDSGR